MTVHLMNGQKITDTKTVSEENGWQYAFSNVPKYDGGKEIQYTLSEEPVAGYVTIIDGTDIINCRVPDKP